MAKWRVEMPIRRRKPRSIVQENPLKIGASVLATVAIIVGAAIGVDDRYAHAGDIVRLSNQLEVNRLTAEVAVLEIRQSNLRDKVFEGQSRKSGQRSDIEILDRYQRELVDVEKQIGEKRRAIDDQRKK